MTAKLIVLTSLGTAVALLLPATVWLRAKRNDFSTRVNIRTETDAPFPSEQDVRSVPQSLREDAANYVCSIERASKIMASTSLPQNLTKDEALIRYLRANMASFTYTPQARLLKFMCKHADARRTFELDYLSQLDFGIGDLVCGVFRVVYREDQHIELALDAHESFKGPKSEGRLVAKLVDEENGNVKFVNYTVMWRKRKGGKSEILESRLGSWLHELMVMWLVDSGTVSLTEALET